MRSACLVLLSAALAACGLGVVGTGVGGVDQDTSPNDPAPSAKTDGADAAPDPGGELRIDGSAGDLDAGAIADADADADAGADASPTSRRVFVSSSASTAKLGGPSGADAKCLGLANAAGLGGAWRAWISANGSSPSNRFTRASLPYRLVDGTLVANGYDALVSGSIAHAIDRDEKGNLVTNTEVWTGTNTDGTFQGGGNGGACDGFTSSDPDADPAQEGLTSDTDERWTNIYVQYCDRTNGRLYCFEQ